MVVQFALVMMAILGMIRSPSVFRFYEPIARIMTLNNKNILTLIAAGSLFVALSDGLPYGYFTLLRFVVCAVGFYLAYKTYEENRESLLVWGFGFIAILFNPIIPIYLEREQWVIIDLIVGIFFVLSIFLLKIKKR